MAVPGSLVAELGLRRTGVILSVDGKKELELAAAEGEERRAYSARSAADLPWILREYVGRTVSIEYRESMQGPTLKRDVQISEANADAWPMLTVLIPPSIAFEPTTVPVTAEGNPLAALKMGFDEAIYWVKRIYFLLNRMFVQRSVGVEQVSGPVGIFSSAMEQARIGWVDLMYFMALISVNLAVLNFLPIPVMDGGMMVFLLIEKIKGKPLSLKTQMITTLVGLAALLVLAVVVTLQDIGRLFS